MATGKFQKKQTKAIKSDGRYIFADFSEGLYLLDSPRSINQQLASLALKGGRNVWAEYGALVPQYGYNIETALPQNEYVVGITEDSKSSASVFILTMLGNIYHYSAYDGLKKYKTSFEYINEDCLFTRLNNNLVVYNEGACSIFGDYYKEGTYKEITNTAQVSNFGSYAVFNIDNEYSDYFWRGKKFAVPNVGGFKVTSIKEATKKITTAIKMQDLAIANGWTLKGVVASSGGSENKVVLDSASNTYVSIKPVKQSGSTHTTTTKKLQWSCYYYNITKDATKTLFQKVGLPTSGYFYCQENAAINKKLYFTENPSIKATNANQIVNRFFNITIFTSNSKFFPWINIMSGSNASNGAFAPTDTVGSGDTAFTLSRDTSGDFYTTQTITIQDPDYTDYTLTFSVPLADGSTNVKTKEHLAAGQYTWVITNNKTLNKIVCKIVAGESTLYESPLESTGIELKAFEDNPTGEISKGLAELLNENNEVINEGIIKSISVTAVPESSETAMDKLTEVKVSVGEKSMLPIDLIYTPEDSKLPTITMHPKLLGGTANRLCIYDTDGTIYYSAVGIVDDFKEADGAGYFKDFYNDTSDCLRIEDYLNGILVSKQNGLYYVTISSSISSNSVSATNEAGINISKVAEIGQQYSGDHCIVGKDVMAFDSNSGSLVMACTQNVFGNIQSGGIMISSDYINSANLGITEEKRKLVYNSENNCFILYHGDNLNKGLLWTVNGSLFPREVDNIIFDYVRFNQGVLSITREGVIAQDFKRGTIIPNVSSIAEFEPIGLKDNRCILCSILEVSEMHGIEYSVTTSNAGHSYQKVKPIINYGVNKLDLPPMIYSDKGKNIVVDSFELVRQWASKKSTATRIYAPMSGREGVSLTIEFKPNQAFCLIALRLIDFSQGE